MPTYFRYDGWVKSAVGPAVPGAQIYVCDQPANTDVAPPTPLATIFSDPNGLVPITQPIITDGFGHYDFYVLPGTYTQLVALGGVIQQVYEDQSIGIAGSVTTPLVLQTNSVNNALQNLLNFKDSAGATWTSNIDGSITLTVAAPSGLTLQTDGVDNGDQTLLNLKSGSGITIVDDGVGGITLTGTSVPAGVNVAIMPTNTQGLGSLGGVLASSKTNVQIVPGASISACPNTWTITVNVDTTVAVVNFVVKRTLAGGTSVIDTTVVTFGGNPSPSLASGADYTSDVLTVPLDANHDYYIMCWSTAGVFGYYQSSQAFNVTTAYAYSASVDHTGDSSLAGLSGIGSFSSSSSWVKRILSV